MFACVHLLDEVTQRVHTSIDVVAMTHLCDSGQHQSSKREFHHNIHVLTSSHPVLYLPVLHAQLFVVLWCAFRAEQEEKQIKRC